MFVLSVKITTRLYQSIVYFLVLLGIWQDGAPQVGELMDSLQVNHANSDVRGGTLPEV